MTNVNKKYILNNGRTFSSKDDMIAALTAEELCGQLLCLDVYEKDDPAEVEKVISRIKPGGIFVSSMSEKKIKLYTDMANKYSPVPVIVSADVENGPENGVKGGGLLPYPMAWGACGDGNLIKEAGKITARICRENGIHWTFAPIVDINYNFRSSETNIRAISDDPDAVIKYAGAYSDGLRSEGLMVTGAKHFPGGGSDERNSHFCTTVNPLSKEEWLNTYGKVYREMIARGAESVMVGHYSLPSFMSDDEKGLPCVLSKSLMTDLLKGELGFDGCIVSDAMSMIGACAASDPSKLAVNYLKSGGDMILFPEEDDYDKILAAVLSGEIPQDRFTDAVKRVLTLKDKAGLFDENKSAPHSDVSELSAVAQKIADKSITVVRDEKNIIPTKIKRGDKILAVIVAEPYWHKEVNADDYAAFKEQAESLGASVDFLINPKHKTIKEVMNDYDLLIVLCDISSKNYHGGSLRAGWYNMMTFWRGYILEHPKMIFVSLGDPYKLYDFPYLKEYINAYSNTNESQKAVLKVISGEISASGKNPVSLEGFFKREICQTPFLKTSKTILKFPYSVMPNTHGRRTFTLTLNFS